MEYRKLRAIAIFDGKQFLGQHFVLIATVDGTIVDCLPATEAGENIETFNGILAPGFVNCHCHLELSHLHGLIPERTGLIDFVLKVINQRHFPEEEIMEAISSAESQMLQNGIVAVGDICNNTHTIPQKRKGRLAYHNFIEVSGWNPSIAGVRLAKSKSICDEFCKLPTGSKRASINPHAPYSVSEPLWDLMMDFFDNRTVTMHNQEARWEDELFKNGSGEALRLYNLLKIEHSGFRPSGKSGFLTVLPKLAKARTAILVHNTFTSSEDLAELQKKHVRNDFITWCLCPNANLYIENVIPPVSLLRDLPFNIVLGTDSLASNHTLNILDEIKTIRHYHPDITTHELLQWATLNGAIALRLEDRFGSFIQGKRPGINLLENIEGNNVIDKTRVRRIL
jgi:cytosine/adenosine deaminase-related metal-dependent hydrolase